MSLLDSVHLINLLNQSALVPVGNVAVIKIPGILKKRSGNKIN